MPLETFLLTVTSPKSAFSMRTLKRSYGSREHGIQSEVSETGHILDPKSLIVYTWLYRTIFSHDSRDSTEVC